MAHYPLNHPLRGPYRLLAGAAGLYLLAFGVVALAGDWGAPLFHRGGTWALGLRANPAGAGLAALAGLVLLVAAVVGGNLFHRVALVLGWGLLGFAVAVLAFLRTAANVVNASMVNVLVLSVLGLVVLTAGLYGKVGSAEQGRAARAATLGP